MHQQSSFQTEQTNFQTDITKCKVFYGFIFVLKILINFHVSLGKINDISLRQLQIVLCGLVQECRGNLTKLRVKLCSLPSYSVNNSWFFP